MSTSLATRSVARTLEGRREGYAAEVQRLVEASFGLIRDRGTLEPRVGEIVAAAGLSNQAFYRHFRSKDELLVTVLDEGMRRLADYLRHRMDAVDTPGQQVRAWLEGMCEQVVNSDAALRTRPFALSRARLSERFPEEVASSERELTGMLRDAIESAVQAGELVTADPARDAETIYGLAMGWLERKLTQAEPALRVDAEHMVDFALRGLQRGEG